MYLAPRIGSDRSISLERKPETRLTSAALYNIAPAKIATTNVPSKPNPVLLTCGVTRPAAAPALSLAAALPVPLALSSVPLAVELAPPVGVPVAVAAFVPLQKMI